MPLAALASASNGAVIIAHGPTCGSASVLWLSGEAASAAAASAAAFAAPPPSAVRVTGAVALPGLDSTTPLVGAAFSADASTVAAVGDAKTVWLWHLAGGGGAPPRRRCLRPSGAFCFGGPSLFLFFNPLGDLLLIPACTVPLRRLRGARQTLRRLECLDAGH